MSGLNHSHGCVSGAHGKWVCIGMLVHVGGSVNHIGHVGVGILVGAGTWALVHVGTLASGV